MKSLVRVLPAAAYTFNTVPICDPGGPNPHGRVWETFPVPVRDFTPRLHYSRETGFPKPDFRSRTSEAGLWSGAGLTRNWAISQFVSKYTVLFLEPIRSLLDPFQGSHTIIGTSRTPLDSLWLTRNYPNLGYHSECSTKHTVLCLELIRSLLDPFRVSHTIIGTSDSSRLPRAHSELP